MNPYVKKIFLSKPLVIIGHRGAGKTTLGKAFKNFGVRVFDLDKILEDATQQKISEIFTKEGEVTFRLLEKNHLKTTLKNMINGQVLVLGAGCPLDSIDPNKFNILWVKRDSDKEERYFLDRPLLNISINGKFNEIFSKRSHLYSKRSHFSVTLPELHPDIDPLEYLLPNSTHLTELKKGFVTLLPSNINIIKKYADLNIEIRTDHFSEEEIIKFLHNSKHKFHLVALRNIPSKNFLQVLKSFKNIIIDTDIEYYDKSINTDIISYHGDDIFEVKRIYNFKKEIIKWAPLVDDLSTLKSHEEYTKSKDRVHYLPRSTQGSFNWHRLVTKLSDKKLILNNTTFPFHVNFYRLNEGSSLDQPLWGDWSQTHSNILAVFGSDVFGSFTPSFHKKFAEQNNMSTIGINLDSSVILPNQIQYFKNHGIQCAAITSPFKKQFKNKTANTLFIHSNSKDSTHTRLDHSPSGSMETTSTDFFGVLSQIEVLKSNNLLNCTIALWGGYGTLPLYQNFSDFLVEFIKNNNSYSSIKSNELLNYNFKYFSASKKWERHSQEPADKFNPEVVIWACGKASCAPPNNWSPKIILDLDYKPQSYGLYWAQSLMRKESKTKYINGLDFFNTQALQQQNFWKDFL